MFSILNSGGSFMYVILAVSVVAFALFCERAVYLYLRLRMNSNSTYIRVISFLEKMNFRGAMDACGELGNHPLGKILKAGLLKADKRDKEIELEMEEKLMNESLNIKARINYLTLFANISTLLGLLGTILGLISAFEGVSGASAAAKQEILARGISVAMLTTAFGLIVAIPNLVGFYLLNNRSDYIISVLEEKSLGMYNKLTSMKREQGA